MSGGGTPNAPVNFAAEEFDYYIFVSPYCPFANSSNIKLVTIHPHMGHLYCNFPYLIFINKGLDNVPDCVQYQYLVGYIPS